eukprot:489263_1
MMANITMKLRKRVECTNLGLSLIMIHDMVSMVMIWQYLNNTNIKEELLINDIVTLSIGQFEYELQRAKLHYQCQYFRSYIHELVERNHEHSDGDTAVSDTSSHSVSVKDLKLHHILALMVY